MTETEDYDKSATPTAHPLDGTNYHSAPSDITDFNATTLVHGLMPRDDKIKLEGIEEGATKYPDTGEEVFTSDEKIKLTGIEEGADVTDTGNVGEAINSSAEKEIPVNNDLTALIDSETGYFLKKLSWENIKEALQTYFDTLYLTSSLGYTLTVVAAVLPNVTDNLTYFLGCLAGRVPIPVAGYCKIYVPKAGTIKAANLFWGSTVAGTSENISVYIRLNDTTDYLIATIGSTDNPKNFSNYALSIAVVAGDFLEIKIVCPAWVTNPTSLVVGGSIYIE